MDVAPFCTCPKCKGFGLHYMARVRVGQTPKFTQVCKIREVPRVQWYDKRETLPLTQLKYDYTTEVVHEISWWLVRECFFCTKEWDELWKVQTEVFSE